MLIGVIVVFFVSLLPVRVVTLWNFYSSVSEKEALGFVGYYSLLYFPRILFYMNSATNPILYGLVSTQFRNAFWEIACPRRRRRQSLANQHSGTSCTLIHKTVSFCGNNIETLPLSSPMKSARGNGFHCSCKTTQRLRVG